MRALTRRGVMVTGGQFALSLAGMALGYPAVLAQSLPRSSRQLLQNLYSDAARLGFVRPLDAEVGVAAGASDDYDRILPSLVDLIDEVRERGSSDPAAIELLLRGSDLLREITYAERGGGDPPGAELAAPAFGTLKDEYISQFEACTVRPIYESRVAWYVKTMTKPAYRQQYDTVAQRLQIPWWFVGITHALEAGYNFDGHLHNGDSLAGRTIRVPAGYPRVWGPPNDWVSSAVDALTMKNYHNQADWTLARTLYRWEAYNGFGSRRRGINTPYLWSFSNLYTKGKFPRDHEWDPEYVSKQCGTAVILKRLVTTGAVTLAG